MLDSFTIVADSGLPWLLAAISAARLWYALPLITSVSLVCAATRHEAMGAILLHALRFAIWVLVFMAIVLAVIQFLSWMQ
ncbi:MAG TPA: hypothetical protein VHK01_05090 [Lacipirellulaceae bacterium]|jgi:hypothetical protein|nr:hypothetical protein [Lacipirellulaceae bacterium]